MSPEQTKSHLAFLDRVRPVMEAFAAGKPIEYRGGAGGDRQWIPNTAPTWSQGCEYRVKPEPKVIYAPPFRADRRYYTFESLKDYTDFYGNVPAPRKFIEVLE